jgi:hypothetical protein
MNPIYFLIRVNPFEMIDLPPDIQSEQGPSTEMEGDPLLREVRSSRRLGRSLEALAEVNIFLFMSDFFFLSY